MQKVMRGRPQKYNWTAWMDQRPWLLERGKDYTISDTAMARQCYAVATKWGVKCRTLSNGEGLVIQFYTPKEGERHGD